MKYFYSNIIEISSLVERLDELELDDAHKKHLGGLIDSHIHHTVVDVILSELSSEDKLLFLRKISENPEDEQLWQFLNDKTEGIENKIKSAVESLKKELHADVLESKQR